MTPFALAREGSAYRDTALGEGQYPSATALREALGRGEDVSTFVPEAARETLAQALSQYGMADVAHLGTALLAILRANGVKKGVLDGIAECGGGLLERLESAAWKASDYRALCAEAATKRYTDGSIRRALINLLSGVTREDIAAHPVYLRLLGANARGRAFLAKTAKMRTVHVVTKRSEIAALGPAAARQSELARVADGLYSLCLEGRATPHDLQTAKPHLIL